MKLTAFTSSRRKFLEPVPATLNVTVRKSVYDLTGSEVSALRTAFARLQSLPSQDNRSYQYLAGIHGLPQYLCPHGDPLFLIWHRPFVLMFEQALQQLSPGVSLPYWDWTSDRALQEGVPQIFAEQTYLDPSTGQQPNPLYKAAISYPNPQDWTETYRNPGEPSRLADLRVMVQEANRFRTYDRFSPSVEQPHNGLHGWAGGGGALSYVPYAAFDPLFWVHHCFVEKLFCDWQDRTDAPISPAIAGRVLAPFTKTTDDLWSYRTLGYRYAPEGQSVGASARAQALESNQQPPTHVATFDLSKLPDDLEQAELHFTKTRVPDESFEVRVFFNAPQPDASTPKHGNPTYAGSLHTFGHKGCTGGPGHCKVPDVPEDASHFVVLRPEHHLTPRRQILDVTKALRRIRASATGSNLEVHLVLVDPAGKEVPQTAFDFEMLSLDAV